MDKVIDYSKLNEQSVYEQLKVELEKQKQLDIIEIEENGEIEYLEEDIQIKNNLYNLYNEKLNISTSLYKNEADFKKYYEFIYKIDSISYLSQAQKIQLMVGYGVLATEIYVEIKDLNDSELLMLSACSAKMDLEDYPTFIQFLGQKNIAEAITKKDDSIVEQAKIAFSVMDTFDELPHQFLSAENFEEFEEAAMVTINDYQKGYSI